MANNHFKISKGVTLTPQSSEPSSPIDGDVYYDSTLNKFRVYENGAWIDMVASGVGGINYIDNTGAEADISGYSTYDDGAVVEPVDGTGGSPSAVTLTRTTTTSEILRDTASFKFSKSAADGQGEGAGVPFTIDPRDKDSTIQVSFDYKNLDSNFVSGDVRIFVYDIDNATLIGNVVNDEDGDLLAHTGEGVTFLGQITTTNSLNYRLIFHVTTTNSTAYDFTFDNVRVSPIDAFVAAQEQNVIETKILSANVTSDGEITDLTFNNLEVGKTYDVKGSIRLALDDSANDISVEVQATHDGSIVNNSRFSIRESTDTAIDEIDLPVSFSFTATDSIITFVSNSASVNSYIKGSGGRSETYIQLETRNDLEVPNTISNNRLNQLTAKVQAYLSTNQSITATGLQTIELDTAEFDDLNAFDSVNNKIIIQKTGYYKCSYNINATSLTADDQMITRLRKINSSGTFDLTRNVLRVASIDEDFNSSKTAFLEKGDELTLTIQSVNDAAYNVRGALSDTYLEVVSQPDFTTYGVLNPNAEFLSAESSQEAVPSTGVWIEMTGNSVILTPGTWLLTGQNEYQNTGGTGGFGRVRALWALANGDDTATAPTSIFSSLDAGNEQLLNHINTNVGTCPASIARITVTSDTEVFLVPRSDEGTAANQLVTSRIYAQRIK